MAFVCDRCGHCCRAHRVPITLRDVQRLLPLSLPLSSQVELLAPEKLDLEGEPECLLHLREGLRLLVLRHRDDGPQSSACVHLSSSGCAHHEARPLACKTYPFDRKSERPAPHQRINLDVVPGLLCPPETGVKALLLTEKADEHRAFQSAIEERDRELGEYALWVQRFNARMRTRIKLRRLPESEQEFLEHLEQQCRRLPDASPP